MSMPPTISAYYQAALEELQKEVEATTDDRVIGMNADEWIGYLVNKYQMEPIVMDASRGPQMEEVESERVLRGYDIYSDNGLGTVVRATNVRVEVPVIPSDTIKEIWKHGLAPNTFHMNQYPEFEYDSNRGFFALVVPPGAAEVKRAIDEINSGVRAYNESSRARTAGFVNRLFRSSPLSALGSKKSTRASTT
jgi:hypothetical protein